MFGGAIGARNINETLSNDFGEDKDVRGEGGNWVLNKLDDFYGDFGDFIVEFA